MNEKETLAFWDWYNGFIRSGQRKGQALMNALREFPVLYDMVAMTKADPFYDDSKIPAFLETVGFPRDAV